jgi:hypothetical protein
MMDSFLQNNPITNQISYSENKRIFHDFEQTGKDEDIVSGSNSCDIPIDFTMTGDHHILHSPKMIFEQLEESVHEVL